MKKILGLFWLAISAVLVLGCSSGKTGFSDRSLGSQIPFTNLSTDQVTEYCNKLPNHKHTFDIAFEEPKASCDWDADPNVEAERNRITAFNAQKYDLELPEKSLLCKMTTASEESDVYYDDELMLVLNDVILLSTADFSSVMPEKNGFYLFDWSEIVGDSFQDYNVGDEGMCAGSVDSLGVCSWPETQTSGVFSLEYDPTVLQRIASLDSARHTHELSLLTFGDDDPGRDCLHSQINMTFDFTYVILE